MVVCGGGDAGITEAIYLTKIASKVTVIDAMPLLNACTLLEERAAENSKLEIICNKKTEAIRGEGSVIVVDYVDVDSGEKGTLNTAGILVRTGLDANTDFVSDILSLDDIERMPVNESMETEIPLIYAIGDVRSGSACFSGRGSIKELYRTSLNVVYCCIRFHRGGNR